mmetsp:Transcript_56882/g.113152  ORF Transcript_56882/g.113152 Transcript_56882/m.113152 type:complete len:226 (+) Transcript_56882:216-893(+)
MPSCEFLCVTLRGISEAVHRALAEKEAKHAADVATANSMACISGSAENAVDQFFCDAVQFRVCLLTLKLLECLDARSHGKRISTQRSCLVHRTRRGHHLHDVLAPAIGANRQTTTNYFAHGGHIRGHTKVLLSSAIRNTKSSHHLIKDEQGAILRCQLPKALQETLAGLDETGIAHHRFKDDSCYLMLLKQFLNCRQVVVRSTKGARSGTAWHTWRVGQTQCGDA